MTKSIFSKLTIVVLLITIASQIFLVSSVNATSATTATKRIIAPEMATDEVVPISLEEEKIMEYDATTGITREVDMEEVRQSLMRTRGSENSDRIEPYDPLANSSENNLISPRATYYSVSDVTAFPYRATCRIKADVYGETLVGSGYVAGPNIVVTAAHCVMNQNDNDATFADWVAYPGYSNGSSYKGVSSGWSKIYYSSNWKSTHSPAYDWCICILNSNIGDTTGWFGTQSYGSNSEMNGVSVRLLGYPLSVGGGEYQKYTQGTISNTQDYYFSSSAKTVGGFSGGPFARTSDNYVVGVCHGYWTNTPDTSVGVRITQNMIDIIRDNS